MIKDTELREFRPTVRYQGGEGITLQTVQEAIADCAEKFGITITYLS